MAKRLNLLVVGLLTVLLAGGCSNIFYKEDTDSIRLTFGGGGLISSKIKAYEEIEAKNKSVVIDGQMISADAFLAFGLSDVCYTENAVFSPHAASYLGLFPLRKHTEWLSYQLPTPLRLWFEDDMSYYDWIGFANVKYDQLLEIWPEGACSEE